MLAFILNNGVLEYMRAHVASLFPLSRFMVVLAVILFIPPLCRRVDCRLWSGYWWRESS